MSKDRATSEPGGCERMTCGECAMQPCATCPDAPGFNAMRESVDDALLIVGTYGQWGPDLNDAHRRQIVLAEEVLTLRERLAHWRSFAIHAEEEHAAWKKTAIELDAELRALRDPAPLVAWITEGGCECLQRGEGPVRVMPEENHETGFTVPLYARERPVSDEPQSAVSAAFGGLVQTPQG